jgi:circadian clock protein KaiC
MSEERVPTGIPGLDRVLEGGLLPGGVYLVQGPPGAGKTLLAAQMCFARAARGEKAVYATLLSESHARLLGHLRRMRFYDAAAVPDRIYFLSLFKVLERDGVDALQRALREVVTAHAPSLIVIDGLVSAEELAPSAIDFRKLIQHLQAISAMTRCTTLLLASTERPRPIRPELTMVDGVIDLTDELTKLRSIRHLGVPKMRGTSVIRGQHTLRISDDGIAVHPRLETLHAAAASDQVTPGEGRIVFGIAELDTMLGGGLRPHSTTMLLGPSGCGKTVLGLQFLAAGALRGEPGVHFGFYERPRATRLKGRRLGLDLEGAERDGLLELVWHAAIEGDIDLLGEHLFDAVARMKARRLVIDGMQGFQIAVDAPDRIRDVFSAIVARLEREGVTTLYTIETPDLFGPSIASPVTGASAVTHNIILMRHVELRAELHRLISVLKLRDSGYDPAIREFRITDSGIAVSDTFASAEHVLMGSAWSPPTRTEGPQDAEGPAGPGAGAP